MSKELTWDEFRAASDLERISLSHAALLLALERGHWNGIYFSDDELQSFHSEPDGWQSTHMMRVAKATGTVKTAHTAILTLLTKEVDAGRLDTICTVRQISGTVDPDRTFVSMEGYQWFAEVFELETGDLWEDYRDREDKITQAAMSASETARLKAEKGDLLRGYSGKDFSALPEWAQDEMLRLVSDAAAKHKPERNERHGVMGTRETRTLYNVIGALVETCLDVSPGGQRYSVFTSQANLIDVLLARYPDLPGLSQSTLEGLLPKVRKSMQGGR